MNDEKAVSPPSSVMWHPIETAPKDNKHPLYLAQFNIDTGELIELDWDAAWEAESESWEMPQVYYTWCSANGRVEEPTHWAYQNASIPQSAYAELAVERDELKFRVEQLDALVTRISDRAEKAESQLAELRKELADTESDMGTCADHNIELQGQLADLRGRVDSVLTRYQDRRVFRNPHTAQVARAIQEEIGTLAAADGGCHAG